MNYTIRTGKCPDCKKPGIMNLSDDLVVFSCSTCQKQTEYKLKPLSKFPVPEEEVEKYTKSKTIEGG